MKRSNVATRNKKFILLYNTRGSEVPISTSSQILAATSRSRKNLYVKINGIYRRWKLWKIVSRSFRKSLLLAREMSRDISRIFLRTRNFYGGKHICIYNTCDTRHTTRSSIKVSKVMSDISADFSRFNVRDSFFKYDEIFVVAATQHCNMIYNNVSTRTDRWVYTQ